MNLRCPACNRRGLRKLKRINAWRCTACKCSCMDAEVQAYQVRVAKHEPKPRYHGKPAGKIVIGRGAVWGASLV